MTNWTDKTEVVLGAIIAREYNPVPDEQVLRIPINQVRPEIFAPPYDQVVKEMQKGATVEEVVTKHISSYQASLTAVRNLNGTSQGVDWVSMLERSAAEYQAGQELDRFSKKLMRGQEVNWTKIIEIASKVNNCEDVSAYTPLFELSREKPSFIKTGFMPIDFHLEGIPSTGLTTIEGTPGTGKTTLADIIAACFAKEHPDKIVAFHTLEMLATEQAKRFDEITKLSPDVQKRILIRDISESPEELLAKASTIENLGLIIVDFAEYLVRGEMTEAAMTHVFKYLSEGAKNMRLPLILLAQVSKSQYQGGIPTPSQIYYTGAAEKYSWMILAIYNPQVVKHYQDDPDKDKMMLRKGEAALVCWKSRGGFRIHPQESPGGVVIQWDGKRGWRPNKEGIWRQIK